MSPGRVGHLVEQLLQLLAVALGFLQADMVAVPVADQDPVQSLTSVGKRAEHRRDPALLVEVRGPFAQGVEPFH